MFTFGPIPSRRLGRSLGINHIPERVCSFDCVYCQLGAKSAQQTARAPYFSAASILDSVARRVREVEHGGDRIDYLTFVPNGEPTLDVNIGAAIDALRPLGKPIAVITNASLLWRPEVRLDLARANWVGVKVDAVDPTVWRKINRPAPDLDLDRVLEGVLDFARAFDGELTTETMLVRDLNDTEEHCLALAHFLARVVPATAYVAIPTRAPAEPWVHPPDEERLNRAFQIISAQVPSAELLIGQEGDAFASTGDPAADILSITAVHPLRKEVIHQLLDRSGADWGVVQRLLDNGMIRRVEYRGATFYVRTLRQRAS